MYKAQVTPLIGLPRFDGWAHVATISSGTIVFALSVDGQHARNIGRDLIDLINQKDGINSGAELYKLVSSIVHSSQDKEGGLSLACALFKQEAKSTFCVFNGSISLKRDGKSGQLIQSANQLQIIEGNIQLEDTYILATDQAGQFLGEVKQKFDQGFEADTIVTSITPNLHLEETTATSAMAFVSFKDRFEEKKQEQPVVPVASTEIKRPSIQSPADFAFEDELETELATSALSIEPELESDGLFETKTSSQKTEMLSEEVSDWLTPSDEKSSKTTQSQQAIQEKLAKVGGVVTRLLVKSSQGFKRLVAWRPAASGEVYVGQAATRKKLRIAAIIGLVFIIMATSIGFYFYRRSQKIQAVSETLQPFIEEIQQVRAQVEQNPIEARQKLQEIIQQIEALEASLANNQLAQARVAASLEDAKKLYDEISGREEFSELPIFFTSRDQELDILITDSETIEDQFIFFDRQKKQGVVVTTDGVVSNSFSAEVDSDIKDISVEIGLEDLWLLADQIYQTNPLEESAIPTIEVDDEEQIAAASLISAFSNSLYIFNAEERTIFKYVEEEDGFADPTRWIRSVPGLDFEKIVDVVVDGDIWLTATDGEIFRLRSGNRQDFSFTGLEKPFASSVYMYSQEEFANLYFLEPAESRVVITDKNGTFVREVTSNSLAAASHIIVNNDETKLLAVSGSTVYQIDL